MNEPVHKLCLTLAVHLPPVGYTTGAGPGLLLLVAVLPWVGHSSSLNLFLI